MSVTTLRPSPSQAGAAPGSDLPSPSRSPRRTPPPSRLVSVGTELALVAVTAAAALSLARLFVDGSFAGPVLAAVVAAHALAWTGRRLRLGLLPSALLSAAGLLLAVAWLVEPHTTTLLIPRGATWRAVVDDLRNAWQRFGDVKAPTAPLRGFVLASVAGAWIAATTSDFFAFRMRARFEAMAPAFTLFVFGSILGGRNLRLPATALYLAAVLAFVLWSEAARHSSSGAWFAGRSGEGDVALLRHGAALGVVALLVAVVVGPHLPGAGSAGLVSWRDGKEGGSRSRVTVSPLVDIRGRLVEQSDLELFTVQSDGQSYWRLTSLDRFDGTIWSSLGTYQPTKGPLPGAFPGRTMQQDYAIGPLGTIWLPAAYRPDRVAGVKGARYDRDSGSLLADASSADNLRYSVASAVPELTQAQLEAVAQVVPSDVARHYLALPDRFPTDIVQKAREVTAGATTAYGRARALQDWFRKSFKYDLNVPPGHDVNAMHRFVFETQRGYCEQFAGTYAAMARAVGLPARVAVGFVPGSLAADGRYHVAGKDAHAWPEVYLGSYGWVAFEPTPGAGRSAPGTAAYTGVGAPDNAPQADGAAPTTTPTTTAGDQSTTSRPDPQELPEPDAARRTPSGRSRVGLALWALAGLAGLYMVGVPAGQRWVVRRRRRAASTPSEQVLAAWQEAEDALGVAGYARRPSETVGEYAVRSAPVVGSAAPQLARLAADSATAGFSAGGVPTEVVAPAQEAAGAVTGVLLAQAGPARRLRWALDPRPLLAEIRRGSPRAGAA